jgi:hypothetical protein
MSDRIPHERLLQAMHYDSETGFFTWLVQSGNAKPGERAGSIEKSAGYRVIRLFGRRYKAHVLAWFYVHGVWPAGPLDHKFGDRDDNRIGMLRPSTPLLNQHNRKGMNRNSTRGLPGVKFDAARGKWKALIRANGKRYEGCRRNTPEEAHEDWLQLKRKHHPTALSFWEVG